MADNQFADSCAFIEDAYFPIAEARIPVLDTGFMRSDLKPETNMQPVTVST